MDKERRTTQGWMDGGREGGREGRLALGTLTSSKVRVAVEEARMPSLSSFFPTVKPGVSRGTMKAEIPEGLKEGGREDRGYYQKRSDA